MKKNNNTSPKDMLRQKSEVLQQMTRILVFLAISIMLCNCKEKDNKEKYRIEVVNSDALTQKLFADQKDAKSVIFITTGAWTSTITKGANSWINFDPEKGDASGRYTVSISLTPNTTGNDRTAVFTIRCGKEYEITITQLAIDGNGNLYQEPGEQPKIIVVNSAALIQELYANQKTATSVVFNTADEWTSTITEGADSWIDFDPLKGNKSGRYTVSMRIALNTTGIDRTAVFTIRCSGEECDITITQKATDINGNLYDPDDIEESIEEYFKRDWDIMQNARTQALEEQESFSSPAIQKILFVACTHTSIGSASHIMDDRQKQFFKDVVKNFKEVVEFWSKNSVIIETEILFIDRNVVIPDVSPTYVTQESIQPELYLHAPVGEYDGILVTAASSMPGSVHLGVKTAGYENLHGYSWFKLLIPTGSAAPPTSYSYVMPKADEAPFLSTDVAIHEWLHQLEFLGGLLNYTFPNVHAYMGPPEFPEYIKYPSDPVWDFAAYYRDLISGKVPYTSGGMTRNIGMYPLMWNITPRFLNSSIVYIMNEANGLYLTYSESITSYSTTPSPWYFRYNGDDRYLILTPNNRSLDISNAWNSEGNAVGIFGVNGAYPQAQNFRISRNDDGTYKMTTTFASNNRVLQRNTGSTHLTGTTINTDNGSIDQKWRLLNKPL